MTTATVTPTDVPADSEAAVLIPPHPDGGVWIYSVLDGSGTVTFADSASELVAMAIPGYGDIPDDDEGHDEALIARYAHLVELAERTQHFMVDDAVKSGALVLTEAGEEILTALFAPRDRPWEGAMSASGWTDMDWRHEVPLVLLASDYAPYTLRETPTGRIVWLDPTTEVTYLRSLNELGLIELRTLDPTAA